LTVFHRRFTYRLIYAPEGIVIETVFQRDVDGVTHPLSTPSVFLCPSTREILPEFMEATSHDTICRVECFLDTVSVVTVDVDVQDPWVGSQEFENSEDDVINIAKARRVPLLSVMKATCPID